MNKQHLTALLTPHKRSFLHENCIAGIADALRDLEPHGSWSVHEHAAHERMLYDTSNPPEAMAELFPRLNASIINAHQLHAPVAFIIRALEPDA